MVILPIDVLSTSCGIGLLWMPQNPVIDKSTMARLGGDRQQDITWADVDPDLCRHMASLGP